MNKTIFNKNIYLGKVDNENIYLSVPSWDCDWYWGFGYLGNKNCHYHLNGLNKNKNFFDAIKEHFGHSFIIKNDTDVWLFCELIMTFYHLKETAEVLGRGGSHYTGNPLSELIKNEAEVKRINEIIMPKLFDQIYLLLTK
jgi:hypothetical protein